MKPGPKPKSLQLKILSGTKKPKAANSQAPQSPLASLKPPTGLTRREKFHWNLLAGELRDAGLLTRLDAPVFLMLVRNLALIDEATAALRRDGLTQRTKLGNRSTSPWIRIRQNAERSVLRIAGDFGLSPSSRSRLRLEAPDPGIKRPAPEDEEKEAAIDEKFFGPQRA